MRVFGRILGFAFALLVALLVGAYIFLQDANRLKPELEALLAENSDYTVKIAGDISWVLFPPLQLEIREVVFERNDASERIDAATLSLKMDLSAMWQDINQWRVTELHLADTSLHQDATTTVIKQLDITDFQLGEPAPFYLDLVYTAEPDGPPMAATVDGTFTYSPATATGGQRIVLLNSEVKADVGQGICQLDASEILSPSAALPASDPQDLLPLAILGSYDFSAQCALSELTIGTETFHDSNVEITNVAGDLNVLVDVQDFMGGTLLTDVDVDMNQAPIAWTVLPEINNVDSQRLLDWTERRLQWIAPIGFNSSIKMRGNTEAALAQSVTAASEFDGGQGQLNITKIKEQLMKISAFTQRSEEVAGWPDLWDYQEFTGRWNIAGPVHDLKFALDNMSVDASGNYDYQTDALDMLANVTINEAPENSPFRINPLLEGTPIPVRCTGPSADPKCRVDQDAAQKIVARALQSNDDSGLRRKLEDKIDEEVPEEYRETARGILDLLGRALEGD